MTRNRLIVTLLSVLVLVFAAGVAYDSARVFSLGGQLTRDEHQTCLIQARGLPAGHELAHVLADLHTLLIQKPVTRTQRRAAAEESRKVKRVVRDLNRHLSRYARLERKQPATRKCTR